MLFSFRSASRTPLLLTLSPSSAYPNTLDTTVSWHDADDELPLENAFPRTFLVTGDITASWFRDSTSQIVREGTVQEW